jgi:hypothetical protein
MKKIILILVVILLAGGIYFAYQFITAPEKEPVQQSAESDSSVVGSEVQAEREQMFEAAREYIKPDAVEGMEVDLKILKQLDKWVLLEIIPLNVETDNAGMILEKVDGKWYPRDWGTILPGWRERVPELFE